MVLLTGFTLFAITADVPPPTPKAWLGLGLLFGLHALIAFAGVSMRAHRHYEFCVSACGIAILTSTVCCCLYWWPVAGWALAVLSRKGVREVFAERRRAQTAA